MSGQPTVLFYLYYSLYYREQSIDQQKKIYAEVCVPALDLLPDVWAANRFVLVVLQVVLQRGKY